MSMGIVVIAVCSFFGFLAWFSNKYGPKNKNGRSHPRQLNSIIV
jgi:uncharacterized membrane protein YqiK